MRHIEVGVESGAHGALYTMIWPQGLRTVRKFDKIEGLLAGMDTGKRDMSRRVPVLDQHNMDKFGREPVYQRHDLIALRDW